MHNKRLYKKLNTLLDWLILALPIWFMILFFINQNFNPITDFENFNVYLSMFFGEYSIFGNMLTNLLNYFFANSATIGSQFTIAIAIMDYAFIVWCLDIVKDLIMLVIGLPFSFLHKD